VEILPGFFRDVFRIRLRILVKMIWGFLQNSFEDSLKILPGFLEDSWEIPWRFLGDSQEILGRFFGDSREIPGRS